MSATFEAVNDDDATQAATGAMHGQASKALIVQGYCLSVMKQPAVNFTGFDKLTKIGGELNGELDRARSASDNYLNHVLPSMINTVSDVQAYFGLKSALADALDPTMDAQSAITLLKTVQEQSADYKSRASGTVLSLQTMRDNFSRNSRTLASVVQQLNVVVKGDDGVLTSINDQLGSIDGKIAGAATGVALSGIAIAGGAFMIVVGSVAEFVTAGTSTPLVVAGVGVVAAGVGGAIGASVALAGLIDLKGQLLRQQAQLNEEVKFAAGLSSGVGELASRADAAVGATQDMANAWTKLSEDMSHLTEQLQRGQTTVDGIRKLFTIAAVKETKTILQDCNVISSQLSGTHVLDTGKSSVADAIRQQTSRLAA